MAENQAEQTVAQSSNEIPSSGLELFVAYDDWKMRTASARTSEDENSTVRYKYEFHIRKPNIIVESMTDQTNPIAHTSFHTFSTKLDVDLYPNGGNEQKLELKPHSKLSTKPEYTYPSPSLGAEVTWQTQGALMGYLSFVLLDKSAMPLARFTSAGVRGNWSGKKLGKMEFMPEISDKAEAVDEAVATLMIILQYHMLQAKYGNCAFPI